MLNINEAQSTNRVVIVGTLKELDIREGTTADRRDYVSGTATIGVEQEIAGKMYENEIPVRMFSMRYKKDGSPNRMYNTIVGYKDSLTSLASCPENKPELASKVAITGGRLRENIWLGREGNIRTGFEVEANFINPPRSDMDEGAHFELSGVVMNRIPELDTNGEETGRLKVKFAIVGYNGRVDVIDLIAQDNAATFIQSNWNDGDTVDLTGAININQSTKTWYEEQGFGEPIKRVRTETRRELIILGGSPSGLDEELSYDANDIKNGLSERQIRADAIKNKNQTKAKPKATTDFSSDFPF